MQSRIKRATLVTALVVSAGLAQVVSGQTINDPAHTFTKVADLDQVPVFVAQPLDFAEIAALEAAEASSEKPQRFAIANEVAITAATDGLWEQIADGKYWMWRMRIDGNNAMNLNFGFLGYHLPEGARMLIYPTFGDAEFRAFTSDDNAEHGQLWTPITNGNDVMIEVIVPTDEADQVIIDLGSVNSGYRPVGGADILAGKSGSCNYDVVCPEGMGWENEISAAGAYSVNGSFTCSGSMINNTGGNDYFLTADHCGISSGNDQSVVIYWNYQNSTCRAPGSGASGGNGNGSLSQFNSGTIWRDDASSSDYTIVELEEPINPSYMVARAGWNRSGDNATSAVGIHHPGVEEKRISFEFASTVRTQYFSNSPNANGDHVRVVDWDLGTTEPGSSGSPLYNQDHQIIGQLHGGGAACGNNDSDWFGNLATSWNLGLQQLLAPGNPGLMSMDTNGTFTPSGIQITPTTDFAASGPVGGPFTGGSVVYAVENTSTTETYSYNVSSAAPWLFIANGSGSLVAGATANVTVTTSAFANGLAAGAYAESIIFTNLTDGDGNTTRDASLDVGSLTFSGPSMPINDNTTTSRTLNVPSSFGIDDVKICFSASHSYAGDLIFRIAHNGTTVTMVDRPGVPASQFGSSASIDGDFEFSDEGVTLWENLGSFPSGLYRPINPMSAFDGQDAQGDWTFTVVDNAGGDTGDVSAWSVKIVPVDTGSCTGDIADDFGTLGNDDGMVSFGDFLALLGLVGPCPGGATGCVGDIADDFGTLGNEDGMVSFGDFLALLGLVGPCS